MNNNNAYCLNDKENCSSASKNNKKLFCQRNRLFFMLSLKKQALLKDLKDIFKRISFAKIRQETELPVTVKSHRSLLLRKLHGVDQTLQNNKITNLRIASSRINGIIVKPGQTFSFWKLVGHPTKRKGYLEGLTLSGSNFSSGIGGGLCQLANMIHWLILNSPLEVVELYHHTDALFPDEKRRVPFGTGAGVFYKHIDYRFKNTSDQNIQLLLWVDETDLCGELRAEKAFKYRYVIKEENNHYKLEGDTYYRISQVYRNIIDKESGETVKKELVLDNHSRVMYDYALIPQDEIINDNQKTIGTHA